jgi:hypothetical protein
MWEAMTIAFIAFTLVNNNRLGMSMNKDMFIFNTHHFTKLQPEVER